MPFRSNHVTGNARVALDAVRDYVDGLISLDLLFARIEDAFDEFEKEVRADALRAVIPDTD
jgi:hypothetical protein